jgi:hypothetical protein
MTNKEQFLQHIKTLGKNMPWADLADIYKLKQGASQREKADYVRKLARRHQPNNQDPLFQEFLEWKKQNRKNKIYSKRTSLPTPYKGNPDNILIVGDLHEPFCLDDYLYFCREQQERFDCGSVVFIGDVIDNHYSSYHDSDPDGLGAGQELEYAINRIQDWYKVFPEAFVTIGNHDRMASRKTFSSGLSSKWVRNLSEVLQTPGWLFVEDIEIHGVYFDHGESASANAKYKQYLQSVVQGHRHSKSYIEYVSGNKNSIFAVQIGCGICKDSYAFAYGKKGPNPIINCGVILDKGKLPILISMP